MFESEIPRIVNWFKTCHHINLNLDNPVTIQDKLIYLNFYDDNPLKSKCADKILIHDYCKEKLGKDICIPLITTYDSTSEINWNELPNQFVIKCNHGSGMNIIVRDKAKTSVHQTIWQLNQWMKDDFTFRNGIESHYHNIQHRILVEEYKNDGHKDLTDYKFLCFNGKPTFCQVINGRHESTKRLNYYDMDFNFVNISRTDFPNNPNMIDNKPEQFELMKKYATKLSQDFKFVRVDFYQIDSEVYLGELTFTPGACYFKYANNEDNKKMGDLLII